MSSRRGIRRPLGSRRRSGRTGTARRAARAGLRVVLDGGAGDVLEREPLDGAVIQVDVGQLGGAEVGLPADRLVGVDRPGAARTEHGEAVVLAGDLGAAGRQVLDRVVGAVVAERELVGLKPDGPAQQLVAEADAVHRQLADQLADRLDDVAQRGRIAGAVGEEDRVGVVARADPRRSRCTGAARRWRPRSRRLRTIESLTPVSIMAMRTSSASPSPSEPSGPSVIASLGVTSRARSRPVIDGSASISSRASASLIRAGNTPPSHRARVADVAHERARVEIGDRRDPAVGQPRQPAALRRPERPRGRRRRA